MTKDLIINTDELTQTRYNMSLDLIDDKQTQNINCCNKMINPYFSIMFFIVFIILLMVVYGLLSYHHFIIFNK